ncbi:MAG: type II CAAX prenyl endopeptidase Rce1 family protein [Candidatus Heimdallarchaeota archaeon]
MKDENEISMETLSDSQHKEGMVDTKDLLYPFAVVLLMLSFFDLAGTLASFGIVTMLLLNLFQLEASLATLLNLAINIIAQLGGILMFLFLKRTNKVEPEEKQMPQHNPLQVLYYVFALDISFLLGVLYFIDLLLEPLGENVSSYEEIFPTPDLLATPIYYLLFFGVLVFGAALAEELIFRRTLIPLLERRGLGMFWTLVISSFMFSLIHTPSDLLLGTIRFTLVHFLGTFAGGLTLGYLYIRTRKVIYPMIMHGLSNGVSGLSLIALESGNFILMSILSYFLLVSLLIGGCVFFWLLFDFFRTSKEPSTWKRIITDFKYRDKRLLPVLIMMVGFVLIEGGRDLVFSIIFDFLGPISRERTLLELIIETGYFWILISALLYFIFRMTHPIAEPDWISPSIFSPFVSGHSTQPKAVSFQSESGKPILCPNCKKRNFPGVTFCVFCGTNFTEIIKQEPRCPTCNQNVLPNASFCVFCGTRLGGNTE